MRNQISFHQPPQDLFLNPAKDPGVTLLRPADFFWREVEPALIAGFASSAHPEINHKIESFMNVTRRHKAFSKAVEFNTVPVLLQNASFRKSFSLANEKCLLSGASGTRLLNRYCWENEEEEHDPEETLVAYFKACQAQNQSTSIPLWQGPLPQGIAIAIECRNTFNYYHFITESLSQLAILADIGFAGEIYFHFPNSPEKTRPFVSDFVAALFPELAGRVCFERSPKDYDYVITALDFFSTYFQFPAEVVGNLDHLAPSDAMWRGQDAYRGSQAILSMNSFHSSLRALRTRALAAIEGKDFSYLPKRFFVGRDRTQARHREMIGEAQLYEMLRLFGFEYVVFEHLTPLEQVAIMAHAEMMISYHGAGFTNMLFAAPEAYVLELGTLQTAIHRWGDFWSIAHAAGCRYVSFFADYNKADPLKDPSFNIDGIVPVALSDRAVAEVMSFIVSILGKLPDLPSPQTVQTLAERLIAVQEFDRALVLLEKHAAFIPGHLGLCFAKAECHKHREEFHSELFALHQAYESDRERWQTLVRIIWCAKKCEAPDVIAWALACLRHDFPKRYSVLTKTKPWMRQIA